MKKTWPILIATLLLLIAGGAYIFWHLPLDVPLNREDIYFDYLEGQRLLQGSNPYARILTGDMLHSQFYPTYFPVFYELAYLAQLNGHVDFADWIRFWRNFFFLAYVSIACALCTVFWENGRLWLGLFAAIFWLTNRWTVKVISMANFDFLPILFMCLSLIVFSKNRWLSLVLFSCSLGLKQIGVFLAPLYLIWVWQSGHRSFRDLAISALLIASVPALSSIPFLIWNAEGYYKSLLFSVTRLGGSHFGALSLDQLFGWIGIRARVPMFLMIFLIYAVALRGFVPRYTAAFLVFMVFVGSNTVFFVQYMTWWVSISPLILLDLNAYSSTHNVSLNRSANV